MNDVQMTKVALLQAQAELDARRQDAAQAVERLRMLRERVSRLRAEEALDGVNHGRRITSDAKEVTGLEQTLAVWPDVEAELIRRIQVAEDAHTAALEADRERTLAELAVRETELWTQFSAVGVQLLEVAAQLGDIRLAREEIRIAMTDEWVSGRRPNLRGAPINPPLPEFPARLLFDRQRLELAKAQLRGG